MTVKELSELWLRYKQRSVKKTSWLQYERIVRSNIDVHLGEIELNQLQLEDVMGFVDALDMRLSRKRTQDIMVVLKSILNYGKVGGYCDFPTKAIPPIKVNKKEIDVFKNKDLSTLEKYLKENVNERNIGLLICMYTGMRIGEVCALHWDNILLDKQMIIIDKTVVRIKENEKSITALTRPKTEQSVRCIPINRQLLSCLQKIEDKQGYVLTGCENYKDIRTYQYYFKKVLKDLNLPSYRFHALRHTFATKCIQCEVDVKSLSEILGHHSVDITLNRYVHSSFEIKLNQIDKLTI